MLGEAQPGIQQDAVTRDAGGLCTSDSLLQICRHLAHDLAVVGVRVHVPGTPAGVHQDDRRAPGGGERAQARVVLQAADVIHDRRAFTEREIRNLALVGVNGDGDGDAFADRLQHGPQARQFIGGPHRRGAGAGRLRADVDDVDAGFGHGHGQVSGARGVERQAAV